MAKSKKIRTKAGKDAKGSSRNAHPARRAARAKAAIGADDVKRMPKAPGDYEEIVDRFTDALAATRFRAPISGKKVQSMARRGQKLGQKASALELRFIAADRARMAAESAAYKSLLSNWRSVQAQMPERPDLVDAFQFMVDWMSVNRAPADAAPGPTSPTG